MEDPRSEWQGCMGAILDCTTFAALFLHASDVSDYLASVDIAELVSAAFSRSPIPVMEERVSHLLFEIAMLLGEGSSFLWLSPRLHLKDRGDMAWPIPEPIVLERAILDRYYVALAMKFATSGSEGRYIFGHELAEHFPRCCRGQKYPQLDWFFFNPAMFSRAQHQSLALWLDLHTLIMVSHAVGSQHWESWTRVVLYRVSDKVESAILGYTI